MNSLVIVSSYHHMNTEKVARVIAKVLGAKIVGPGDSGPAGLGEFDPEEVGKYDLIGFGSGIYGGKHDEALLELADRLPPQQQLPTQQPPPDTQPPVTGGNAFIFSTSAIMGKDKVANDHSELRKKLLGKGYEIVDEFACKGFNTNSFMKYVGGMNKGRPNEGDLANARTFARSLGTKL